MNNINANIDANASAMGNRYAVLYCWFFNIYNLIEKSDEIWLFIEDKLNASVPTYIKNILGVCGYNNAIFIAAMADEDLEYCQAQVRNGNVSKIFVGKEVLEGCSRKKDDFEFVLGHKKFLMAIVDFMKTHLKENGPGSFGLQSKKCAKLGAKSSKKNLEEKAKKSASQKLDVPLRKKKF